MVLYNTLQMLVLETRNRFKQLKGRVREREKSRSGRITAHLQEIYD